MPTTATGSPDTARPLRAGSPDAALLLPASSPDTALPLGAARPARRAGRSDPGPHPGVRSPAGAVLAATRQAGPSFRDRLAATTGLSTATVNRQVSALLEAGMLRERLDLVPVGAVGRPRIPVEVDPDRLGVLGMYIGLRATTLSAGDLRGRVLDAVEVPNPDGAPSELVRLMTARLRRFGQRWPRRRMVQVGLVVGGQLSTGRVGRAGRDRSTAGWDRSTAGWDTLSIARTVDRLTHADVVVMPRVEAMAAADALPLLLGQAFTGYHPALRHVSAEFDAATALEPITPRVSALGADAQALAACTAALQPVYRDPLGVARTSLARAAGPGQHRGR